jgi:UDP-N-acetylmuramoyl-tripeptide--D-alanyl-D-alanine ligase
VNVKEAASLMGADVTMLSAELFDKSITDFSIDSRSVKAGEVFFALSQEDYVRAGFNGTFADGHEFIPQAFERGAVAAVARADRVPEWDAVRPLRDRLLVVDDAIVALQNLARQVYQLWARPVVAITGSAGKTTAKELTAHVLSHGG